MCRDFENKDGFKKKFEVQGKFPKYRLPKYVHSCGIATDSAAVNKVKMDEMEFRLCPYKSTDEYLYYKEY